MACKIDSPPDVRPDRFNHGACKRNSPPTQEEIDSITGRVIETPLPMNETDYSTVRLRKSPQPLMNETDSSTGYVIETLHSPNHETDSRTGHVR